MTLNLTEWQKQYSRDGRTFLSLSGRSIFRTLPVCYESHVLFHRSYAVPVLYFNAYEQSGRSLDKEDVCLFFGVSKELSEGAISQEMHPCTNVPFWMVHPCKTAHFMEVMEQKSGGNRLPEDYLLSWLNILQQALGGVLRPPEVLPALPRGSCCTISTNSLLVE